MDVTPEQLDALQELVNIGIGRAAGMLNEMLGEHVRLRVPSLRIVNSRELPEAMAQFASNWLAAVQLGFSGPFAGSTALIFSSDSAAKLVSTLTGDEEDETDLDTLRVGTLSEVGNIVINGVMGSISNLLQQALQYSLPTYIEGTLDHYLTRNDYQAGNVAILAQTRFAIEQLSIEGDVLLLFEVGSFDGLLHALNALLDTVELPHA